jgi:5-methylcytosine-specific restriction protein B
MEEKDENRIEFVQFHQSYSYEDFMMGYKPVNDGFELKYGIFYRFCQKAANQPDKDFFFIIDEINRGNLSRIFGELLMLLERDYREVPKNVFIIGMMNTADRSLAMMDYALRRRFSFFELKPGFDSEGFVQYQHTLRDETFDRLISIIKELNNEIALDNSLGKGFCIGHSYFCGQSVCTDIWLQSVIQYEVLPMLNEYWFDDPNKLQKWDNLLSGVFQ